MIMDVVVDFMMGFKGVHHESSDLIYKMQFTGPNWLD